VVATLTGATALLIVRPWDDPPGGPGDTPAGSTSPAGTPPGPPVVPGRAAAGEACGWQQEGNTATGSAGDRLVCVRTADGYRWQAG
jgi:hypothetical protein